ncbi:MAG: hypothetical protein IKM98_12700, partial [Bacteroidales bacterium]|nr:hypothetical protein [Bacteroidales bacterium]
MKYTIALLLLFVLDVGVAMAQSGGTPKAITKSQQTELDRLEKEVVTPTNSAKGSPSPIMTPRR